MELIDEENIPQLTNDEISRYSRHLLLPEIGVEGQRRLKASRVLVLGAGGLGSPIALYLAAAGVGTIGVADCDEVDSSNLSRQILHSTRDIGRPKTASAKDRLKGLNPYIKIVEHNRRLDSSNALGIFKEYDVIADGTDNYQTRYLVNDACVMLGKPNVYGSLFQFEGQASVFDASQGPCYRCLYPTPPPPGLVPSCSEAGVMGALAGIIGSVQAVETIKLIAGKSESGARPLIGRLMIFDAWSMTARELKLEKDVTCPVCGASPSITTLDDIDYEQFCGLKPPEAARPVESVTALELKARLDAGEPVQLIDTREPHERAIARFPGARVIPLGQLVRRMGELDTSQDAVLICKIGSRSVFGIRALQEAGYTGRLLNLQDGMNAWARDVDKSLPQY